MPFINDEVYDQGLDYADVNGTRIDLCSQEPTTYTEATSTYTLANKTGLNTGATQDASGSPSDGRSVIVPAITDGDVTGTGTATHWALTNGSSTLIATGALLASKAFTSGNKFSLDAIELTIYDAVSGGGAATATWNPSDKHADITLSNGNLTATQAGTNVHRNVRATLSASTGKKYHEITVGAGANANSRFAGLAVAGASLTAFLGSDANSVGYTADNGVTLNGSAIGNIQSYGSGSIIGVAVDLDADLIWFRTDLDTDWNNSGTANPSTGTGGLDISGMTAGAKFPACGFFDNGHNCTANFGATAYDQTAPSGFANW